MYKMISYHFTRIYLVVIPDCFLCNRPLRAFSHSHGYYRITCLSLLLTTSQHLIAHCTLVLYIVPIGGRTRRIPDLHSAKVDPTQARRPVALNPLALGRPIRKTRRKTQPFRLSTFLLHIRVVQPSRAAAAPLQRSRVGKSGTQSTQQQHERCFDCRNHQIPVHAPSTNHARKSFRRDGSQRPRPRE